MRGLDDHLDNYGDPNPPDNTSRLTEHTLRYLAEQRQRAAANLDDALTELRSAVLDALAGGMSESEAARLAGVQRQTVRSWQGK